MRRSDNVIAGFTHDKMIHTMPDETYDIIMKIHVRVPFRLIRAVVPYFRVKVRSSALNPFIFEQ
jgi:3-oxoacyl-[acyl-carrier protein] reductase